MVTRGELSVWTEITGEAAGCDGLGAMDGFH